MKNDSGLRDWNLCFPAMIPETTAKMIGGVRSGDTYWQECRLQACSLTSSLWF